VLLVSEDLGETWQELPEGGLAPTVLRVDFADDARGVATGLFVAQRTDDGGRSWTTQLADPRRPPDDYLSLGTVQVDESGTAVALGTVLRPNVVYAEGYEVWRLPANGSTPQRGEVAATARAPIGSMCLTSAGIGVAAGSTPLTRLGTADTTTLGSDDGGATWSPLDETVSGHGGWLGTACAGERDLWRFGSAWLGGTSFAGVILHSEDGGATWARPVGIDDLGLTTVTAGAFADRRTGWLCAADENGPVVLRTDDAGETFVRQTLPAELAGPCSDIVFADERLGVLGGAMVAADTRTLRPYVAFTTDGGATWRSAVLPAGLAEIRDVDATR